MSMGSPLMVAGQSLNRREVRDERRWERWRDDTGMISLHVRQDDREIALRDSDDDQSDDSRRQALKRARLNRRRLSRQYCKLPLLMLITGLSWLLAAPIDAWDRWMTVDAARG